MRSIKIAFWGNARGPCGVTSNLACISVVGSLKYSYKSILIENHVQKNQLEHFLVKQQSSQVFESSNYVFRSTGMLKFMNEMHGIVSRSTRESSNELLVKEEHNYRVKEASIEILDQYLYYIPTYNVIHKENFDYFFSYYLSSILSTLDDFADIIYIDTKRQSSLSTKAILAEVDLIVVNLEQNEFQFQSFFENYSSILSKSFFLMSGYHTESIINLNYISKSYHIQKSKLAIIPYNLEYKIAVQQGNIIEFLLQNFDCKKNDPNYYFIHEVKEAVRKMSKQVKFIIENRG